ncbi:MAG: hypothetical protein QM760_19850 [Nibricoccus sp.]
MNAKMFLRAAIFLLMLFVVLYTGMNNTHRIDFYFPVVFAKKIAAPAAFVFFALFAIGVLAGMALNAGGSGKSASSGKRG